MKTVAMPETSLLPTGPRARVRQGVQPLARGLGRLGLTPNALTLIGFGIAVVAAYFAATQVWLYAGALVIVGAVFDLFDGALARATGTTSKFGAFLDSTMDRWGEAVVYVGLVIGLAGAREVDSDLGWGPLLAAGAMASAFMVSYVRAKSESLGFTPGTGMASIGLAPREVRVVILTIGLLAAGFLSTWSASWPTGMGPPYPFWWQALVGSLALITVLATITTIQRVFHVYREAKKQEQQ
ncbi:MAG: CDP-alcohol phosphatidyltransferase family protein [Chloroflexota bacterium]|nr:CDP-alcohol phosphatidyltransferase family protein [Chloroflexota bacterium]